MTSSDLANFDFLQLLLMLSAGQKTGVLRVQRRNESFQCWLERGRVRSIRLQGPQKNISGLPALISMLKEPSGRFQFSEGLLCPEPHMNSALDPLAYVALAALPDLELPFTTPARIAEPERLTHFSWTPEEQRIMDRICAHTPLGELADDPHAQQLAARLARLDILRPRKLRTARLLITVTHDVAGVVLVDEMIVSRWAKDLARLPQDIGVRADNGKSYRFPLRSHPNLGALLAIPPDVLTKTRLRGGESVLVKPI